MIITGLDKIDSQSAELYISEKYNISRADFGISSSDNFIKDTWVDDGKLYAIVAPWMAKKIKEILEKDNRVVYISVDTPFFSDEDTATLVRDRMYEKYGELSFLHDMLDHKQVGVTHTYSYAITPERFNEIVEHHPSLLIA